MIFCEDMRTVRIVSTLIGGGDTQILIAIICFELSPLGGSGDAKTLLSCHHSRCSGGGGGGGLAGSQGVLK